MGPGGASPLTPFSPVDPCAICYQSLSADPTGRPAFSLQCGHRQVASSALSPHALASREGARAPLPFFLYLTLADPAHVQVPPGVHPRGGSSRAARKRALPLL